MLNFLKYTFASLLGSLLAGLIGFFLFIAFLVGLASLGTETINTSSNSVLSLKLNKPIVERAEENPLSDLDIQFKGFDFSSELGLDQILESIEAAMYDDNIKGLYLNPSYIMAGFGTVEEIRTAIIHFKESGKFVYAYAEALDAKSYYLCSAADKIAFNPQGMLEFKGLSGSVSFYKEALNKLGIQMEVIRHGKFKSAVEPFITDHMSPESKEQMQRYLDSLWGEMLNQIATSRNLSVENLNAIADQNTLFEDGTQLINYGLIDTLLYKDQVLDELAVLTGNSIGSPIPAISPDKYAKTLVANDQSYTRNRIAVIYAEGGIDISTDGINSEELAKTIREARKDSLVKAVVLRVNSPGGSAYGSEQVWREVKLTTETKPLVVSMGDYAASGGYYIACAADEIFAENTTITGSIGIYAQIPNATELLTEKMGITQDFVGTNENAVFLPTGGIIPVLSRPLNVFEQTKLQRYIEHGYDVFITRVAEGRGMSKAAVDSIGQGRVWAARDALNLQLIDEIGSLDAAIQRAAELANIDNYFIRKLPELEDPFSFIVKDASTYMKNLWLKNELGHEYRAYMHIKDAIKQSGVLTMMPYQITIQ
ncbi:MAG: signal peptide peptidase SppA [Mangrovibacterium sp.]